MRIIKYTHACVRLERDGRVLVVDPGIWSEPQALLGADAVLVTHEHADHIDRLRLAGAGVPVFAPAGARIPDLDVRTIHPDEEFTAAGFTVRAVGGWHAPVYGESSCVNVGYLVDGLYHPGDALHVPDHPVDTVLVPLQASWLKAAEAIEFVRAVRPAQAIGMHEGQLNERGLAAINRHLTTHSIAEYHWLAPATPVPPLPAPPPSADHEH
ncbi:MBL fold metallo-hydrolase [Actinobacteria bacterium YIM 96077]|uniref:MBL fold metallo-hydrolase n=1 Tax=Phytoactinopolyspora halophila TaxID=1981511 RepID=A0A329QVN2_9ACTN|nr:MBL fold metallo-hydrolase [Phytoactinopolyspora halophila]AYY14236.1 MBL fold metallo-hydrolase [Actinobacteria bacterium YIM 96077]RAW14778.1 MBL fold metallo-hydrolase [Phytoactinopolyspora halophila]